MTGSRRLLYGGLAAVGVAVPSLMVIGGAAAQAAPAPVVAVPQSGSAVLVPVPTSSPGFATASTTIKNTTQAGYFSNPGAITSFDATVVVPTLVCPTTGALENDASVQIAGGTSSSSFGAGSFIFLSCNSGVASYSAGTFVSSKTGEKTLSGTVSAGDRMVTRITLATASGITTADVKLIDETTKTSVGIKGSSPALTSSYGWDVFQGSGQSVIDFGKLHWGGALVNGGTLAATNPTKYVLATGTTSTSTVLVSTSAIGSTGKTFTNKFLASS